MKWWTVKVTSDDGEEHSYRTQAGTWDEALADISDLFRPEGREV